MIIRQDAVFVPKPVWLGQTIFRRSVFQPAQCAAGFFKTGSIASSYGPVSTPTHAFFFH